MTRTTTRHTIVVQSSNRMGVTRLEGVGSAVLLPGQVIELKSVAGKYGLATAGSTDKLVVLENQTPDTHSYPTTAAIDIRYASDDTIYFCQAQAGDVLNMWFLGTATKGVHYLKTDGSGHVKPASSGTAHGTSNPIGIAWETKTASAGSAVRCLVRII